MGARPWHRVSRFAFGRVVLCGVALVCAACSDHGASATHSLIASDAWARAADSGATGGAYVTLKNADSVSLTITGVSSDVSPSASIHETMDMEGMSHMMARPSITIERDSTLRMTAGGLHVMLHDLSRRLRTGDSLTLRFTVSRSGGQFDSTADGANMRVVPVVVHVRTP